MIKKLMALMSAVLLGMTCLAGCAESSNGPKPFAIEEIEMDSLSRKMEDRESFALLVERDGCEFCEAMNTYLDLTKNEHPDLTVYRINTSDMHLYKEAEDDKTLVSDTEEGKAFLEKFPYFLYTPAIYKIEEGKAVDEGIGYDATHHTVSNWNVDSPIEWDRARPIQVWEFIQEASGAMQDVSSEQ